MNRNKKIALIAICVILICAIAAAAVWYFTSDRKEKPSLRETVENRTQAYMQDLSDSTGSMKDSLSVRKYLLNWAESKGISVTSDNAGNVIYSLEATEGLEDRPPVVIACGYDYNCMNSYLNSITCALTVAKNDMPHGKYSIIFISEEAGSKDGAKALSASYFTDDTRVFFLNDMPTSCLSLLAGGCNEYAFSKKISFEKPQFTKAYSITVSGLSACRVGANSAEALNPIKVLGNLLASFKSGSVLFELAEIHGGVDSDITPPSAGMTVLVSEDAVPKFEEALNSAVERFYDEYSDDYPDAQYAFTALEEAPGRVISLEDTETLVSLLYTAASGVHYRDDHGYISSVANVGFISSSGGKLSIRASAASFDADTLSELDESYGIVGALTSVDFNMSEAAEPFEATESGKELSVEFETSYRKYRNTDLPLEGMPGWIPLEILSEKNGKMPMIALGVTAKTTDNFAGGLITFLQGESEQ